MGASHQVSEFEAIQSALRKQRNKYICIILLLVAVSAGFIAATAILAVKVQNEESENGYPAVKVEYHVWTKPEALQATKNFGSLKVPKNVTVFSVMEHAAQSADHFKFEYTQYTFGKYITSIGGVKESPAENTFWMFYHLPGTPDPNNPPAEAAQFGIDDIRAKDGDVYLFWLTKINLTSAAPSSKLGGVSPMCINGRVDL